MKKLIVVASSLAILAMLASGIGCGSRKQEGQTQNQTRYETWKRYTYGQVVIHYPEGHLHEERMHQLAQRFNISLERDCAFLQMPVPEDTVHVFFYTGVGQGEEFTGTKYPFAEDGIIHFWLPSFLGSPLAGWLLPHWQDWDPQFRFLKHGLIAELDYSGQNYHQMVVEFADEGRLMNLGDLAVDTTVNVDTERYQTAMAASFVDFVVYKYGMEGFKLLYRGESSFDMIIGGLFQVPVDSLQQTWINFARDAAAGRLPEQKAAGVTPADSSAATQKNTAE